LHNILYWCPKCGRELTLETEGLVIRCTACGNSARIDKTARLIPAPGSVVPEDVQSWYRDQSRFEISRLREDMEPVGVDVKVRMPANTARGLVVSGEGRIWLDPEGWHYDGTLQGETVSLFFPIETVPALPFDPDDNFQIYSKGTFYALTPEDGRLCSKFATTGECAYWRFASRIQMTAGHNSGFNKN